MQHRVHKRRPPAFTPEQYAEAADRCFKYRQQNELSQRELAAELGTRAQVISNLECQVSDPRPPYWLMTKISELDLKTDEEIEAETKELTEAILRKPS